MGCAACHPPDGQSYVFPTPNTEPGTPQPLNKDQTLTLLPPRSPGQVCEQKSYVPVPTSRLEDELEASVLGA